jgi:hypothetical protein
MASQLFGRTGRVAGNLVLQCPDLVTSKAVRLCIEMVSMTDPHAVRRGQSMIWINFTRNIVRS